MRLTLASTHVRHLVVIDPPLFIPSCHDRIRDHNKRLNDNYPIVLLTKRDTPSLHRAILAVELRMIPGHPSQQSQVLVV
jgi:hypothetical protein